MPKKFSIHTAKCGERYSIPTGETFEFRYVSASAYGIIFVIFDTTGDAYLFEEHYINATLVEKKQINGH